MRRLHLVRAGGSGLVYVIRHGKGAPKGRPTRWRASSPAAFLLRFAARVLGGTWCVLGSLEGLSFQRVAVVCVSKSTGPGGVVTWCDWADWGCGIGCWGVLFT